MKKKVFNLIIILSLVLNMFAPLTAYASEGNINVQVSFTGTEGVVSITSTGTDHSGEGRSFNGTLNGFTDPSETNTIEVCSSFGMPLLNAITINGEAMAVSGTEDCYHYNVAGATSYNISAESSGAASRDTTVIWVNPDYVIKPTDDINWLNDFSIVHGYARAIEVYDENNNRLQPSNYINTQVQPDGSRSDEFGLTNGFGWIKTKAGYRVVFEFIPEYGYQLTSIMINEQPVDATGVMNRFEFIMPEGGNIHFAATFSKVDDVVSSSSSKVSSGTVDLGNNLSNGTARLNVSDVELSDDKIKGFEKAASGYTVSNYLNIDLYNVFYKGKNDANDVWSNQIEDLDEEATISFVLEEGIDANEIVIVHNVHDGDDFEIIPIESYDPVTRTVTFKTKSFSNYAIGTKGTKNAKTGDTIHIYIELLGVSVAGAIISVILLKKNKQNN